MSVVLLAACPTQSDPVFLIHGVNGTVLPYRVLASRLCGAHSCFAVEARGVDGQEEPLDCVEAMAAAYCDEIRAAGEPRRWLLVGWSFGGLVAYEMALQLGRAGGTACAALLDTRALLDPPSSGSQQLEAAGEGAGEFAVMQRLRSVYAAHVRAARRYHPGRFEGPLAVLGADPVPADPTLGFGSVSGGPLRVAHVPGSHESLLAPPHVDSVAAELRSFFAMS